MDLPEIRARFPQYNDLSDDVLADRLYQRYYSDMDRGDFNSRIGYMPQVSSGSSWFENAKQLGSGIAKGAGGLLALAGDLNPLGGSLISGRGFEHSKNMRNLQDKYLPEPTEDFRRRGQKALGGITQLIPFSLGDELAAGAAAVRDTFQGQNFGESYDRNVDLVRSYRDAFNKESPIMGGASTVIGAFTMPVPGVSAGVGNVKAGAGLFSRAIGALKKAGAFTGEAAALGGAYAFGAGEGGVESRLGAAERGAETSAKIGAALGAPLAAASAFAPQIRSAGEAMRRKSVGAQAADYRKTADNLGIWSIVDDAVSTPAKGAIHRVLDRGIIKGGSAEKNLASIIKEKSRLGKELQAVIDKADDALPGAVSPKFHRTEKYISTNVPAHQIKKYQRSLDKFRNSLKTEGKTSLNALQQQKSSVGRDYQVGENVQKGFDRALYHDLQEAIETIAPKVKGINKQLSDLEIVEQIVTRRALPADEAGNLFSSAIQKLRTSGGTLTTPTIIGGTLGAAGGPVGLGVGATLGAASSPAGMNIVGKGLQRLGSDPSVLGAASNNINRVAAALGGTVAQEGDFARRGAATHPEAPWDTLPPGAVPSSEYRSSSRSYQNDSLYENSQSAQSNSVDPTNNLFVAAQTGGALSRGATRSSSAPTELELLRGKQTSLGYRGSDNTSIVTGLGSLFDNTSRLSIFSNLSDAVEKVESNHNPNAVSPKGAIGLMQLMPISMRDVLRANGVDDKQFTDQDLRDAAKDPVINKQFGDAYLEMMTAKYEDSRLALAAYNAGPTRVDSLLKKHKADSFAGIKSYLPRETQQYVLKVEDVFERLMQENQAQWQ